MVEADDDDGMEERDTKRHDPEMSAVVEDGKEAGIQSCERADAEDDVKKDDGARSRGAHGDNGPARGAIAWVERERDEYKPGDVEEDRAQDDGVIDSLVTAPLDWGI